MRMMEELKELLWDELEKFADKGVISMADLESIHKITDTIKNIKKIEMYDDGYSRGGNWEAVGTYGDYHRNLKRNSRGRYSYGEDPEMVMEKIQYMLENNDLNDDEKSILKKSMSILRK